ncbi:MULTISPECIES: hypothetical protein [Marinobacter]|uniref:Sulfotransferase domain-containing protein n=1 Tax=Marinobacter nauticus (strain ATCC 700491 / DSM 11845 / VT8) TaxID=351348 RepID=A1U3Y2_MARN8|nr:MULTISPECIES: hypothetical protein [Marinobacter]ABM19701.1 hypothetical protein Maqu_2626 [Marinobacter nauticus VT8]
MKTVYLHIGANKTGSTSIQRFMNNNKKWLADHDVFYPNLGVYDNAHYEVSEFFGFGPKLSGAPLFFEKKLSKCIAGSEQNKVVLSSEYLMLDGSIDRVKSFLSDYRVKVILYIRRHDLWFESLYNQAVKTAQNPPWEKGASSYLDYQMNRGRQRFDYLEVIERWASAFGKDAMIVRPFERQQFFKKDLISDFIKSLGVGFESRPHEVDDVANESLSVRILDFVDSLNRIKNISADDKALAIKAVSEMTKGDKKRFALSPSQRIELIRRFEPSYKVIATTYLNRSDGRLFYEDFPEADADWMEPEKATLAQAIGLFAKLSQRIQF